MIIELEKLDSTNEYLNNLIAKENLQEGTIVITQNQTQGKGQQGNTWISECGKNLTFSLLLKPNTVAPENMFLISKAISIGIIKYLNSLGESFLIKWPNDIYYNDKKICGILVENQLLGSQISHSTIGIGLNINQTKWTEKIPNPISLKNIFGEEFDLPKTLNKLVISIIEWYNILIDNNIELIQNEYFKNLYRNKGFFKYYSNGDIFEAKISNVSCDGMLNLSTIDGKQKGFYFKEVQFMSNPY